MKSAAGCAVLAAILSSAMCLWAEEAALDKPKPDYIFRISQAAYFSSVAADWWSTKTLLHDRKESGVYESNPLIPENLAGMTAVMAGSSAITGLSSWYLNRKGMKWWARGILWGSLALHTWAAFHNHGLRDRTPGIGLPAR